MTIRRTDIRLLQKTLRSADAAFVSTALQRHRWTPKEGKTDREMYAELISAHRWKALAQYAQRAAARAQTELQALRAAQRTLAQALDATSALLSTPEAVVGELTALPRWNDVRAALLEKYATTAARRMHVLATLSTFEGLNGRHLLEDRRRRLELRAKDLDHDARRACSSLVAARFAEVVVAINAPSRAASTADRTHLERNTVDLVALRPLIASGDWSGAKPWAATLVQSSVAAVKALVGSARPGATARSRQAALRAGEDLRQVFARMAIGLSVQWLAGWPDTMVALKQWQDAARTLRASTARTWPKGRDVKGTVVDVKVKHVHGKPVSVARIKTTTGTTLIGLAHIKLDSTGIVAGATVSARCKGARAVEWYPDEPVAELLRFSTQTAAEKQWADWLVLRTAPVFMSHPNGLAASWTLQPGRDGAGNPLRYGVWTDGDTYERRPYGGV